MSTTVAVAPARPDASIIRNAPARGDPNRVLTAAKLPVAATTDATVAGTFPRWASRTASTASPPPRAISGASGPTTTPSPMLTTAAAPIPPSSAGAGKPPPARKPLAGDSPPWPGRYRTTGPTSAPATPSGTSGHHRGAVEKPKLCGNDVNAQPWIASTSARNQYATAEIGTPSTAATTRNPRYRRERRMSIGATGPAEGTGGATSEFTTSRPLSGAGRPGQGGPIGPPRSQQCLIQTAYAWSNAARCYASCLVGNFSAVEVAMCSSPSCLSCIGLVTTAEVVE